MYVATLGVEVHPYNLNDGSLFKLWDTAGQEKFGGLRYGYYLGADCGIIFFDPTSRISFTNIKRWYNDLKKYTEKIVLVNVKSELPSKVKDEDIAQIVYELDMEYFALSTKHDSLETLETPLRYFAKQL